MRRVMWRRVWTHASPAATFVLLTLALAYLGGRSEKLWILAASGAALLLVGILYECWRGTQITLDLNRLRTLLLADELPDLSSLRLATAPAKELAAKLQALLNRVQSATRDEEHMRREIETAQDLRVSFVASMGHDLRGPLASMLGFADLLLMDKDERAQEQRASVQTIRQRTLDLLTLIDEMLDWARLESGRLTLVRRPTDANEILQEIKKMAESRSAGRGMVLNIEAIKPLPKVAVDLGHLPRAVVAVMGDAIRNASHTPLRLTARADVNDGLLLTLHDPNLLIRDEDQASFFEAFRPSYAPSGKRIAGLGLGAACAKSILHAHGGGITFTSNQTEGTKFYLAIPLQV